MTHRELAEDLAQAKNTPLIEVHLGSPWLQTKRTYDVEQQKIVSNGVQRADVVNIRPSYTRFCIDIFEIKTSRADFLNDLRSGKWTGYLPHCHRFYFALRSGIAEKKEIPEKAGLYVCGERGWTCSKGAKAREVEVPYMTLLSLLFYQKKALHSIVYRKQFKEYHISQKQLRKFGKKIARAVNFWNDLHTFEERI